MAKGYEQEQYEKQLSEAASLLAGEVPAGKERDYLIELSHRFQPKPEYADGTIARVHFWATDKDDARVTFAEMKDGSWVYANGITSYELTHNVTRVEPLRVLGDDEMAVKRFEVDYMGPCDTTAKFMREAADRATKLGHGSNVTRAVRQVLRGYADALDAEAGDQS